MDAKNRKDIKPGLRVNIGNNHPMQERARMSNIAWKNDAYKQARGAMRDCSR